jgi:hypothetical protein
VDAVGPIRQLVQPGDASQPTPRRYLAIAAVGAEGTLGPPVQVQAAAAPPASGTAHGTGAAQ